MKIKKLTLEEQLNLINELGTRLMLLENDFRRDNKPTTKEAPHQFKVGEEVVIKGLSFGGFNHIGEKAIVLEANDVFVLVERKGNQTNNYRPCDLELVKVDYEAKYNQLETELRLSKHEETFYKNMAEYYEKSLNSKIATLELASQTIIDLKLKLMKYESAELKVGDSVEILAETGQFGVKLKGRKGKVYMISKSGWYPIAVICEDAITIGWYYPQDLKKVS